MESIELSWCNGGVWPISTWVKEGEMWMDSMREITPYLSPMRFIGVMMTVDWGKKKKIGWRCSRFINNCQ